MQDPCNPLDEEPDKYFILCGIPAALHDAGKIYENLKKLKYK